jgi:hypothetical protein
MQPQLSARLLLPAQAYTTLVEYATQGVPTDCGPHWPPEIIAAAKAAGPHVSALTPENVSLIWDEIQYQRDAGFIKLVEATELFNARQPPELKISRLAVVPQRNRRGRLILNLSAPVDLHTRHPGCRRTQTTSHPSVNDTTEPAAHQLAVQDLGNAIPSLLLYMLDTPSYWEIRWAKN